MIKERAVSIAERFEKYYENVHSNNQALKRRDFYCGITDDLERRATEHKVKKFDYYEDCSSFEVSSAVEKILAGKGFDCGEKQGEGNDKTVYVYMYRKVVPVKVEDLLME